MNSLLSILTTSAFFFLPSQQQRDHSRTPAVGDTSRHSPIDRTQGSSSVRDVEPFLWNVGGCSSPLLHPHLPGRWEVPAFDTTALPLTPSVYPVPQLLLSTTVATRQQGVFSLIASCLHHPATPDRSTTPRRSLISRVYKFSAPPIRVVLKGIDSARFVLSATCLIFCSPVYDTRLTLFCSSGRFRGGGKSNGTKSPGGQNGASPTSPTGTSHGAALGNSQGLSQGMPHGAGQPGSSSSSQAPRVPPLPSSPSLASSLSLNDSTGSLPSGDPLSAYNLQRPLPLWLNNAHAQHIVKGNFMTLSARPKTVEQGEWIAHQGEIPSKLF